MSRTISLIGVAVIAFTLCGCPASTTTQQREQAAKASQNISIILQGAQQAEIIAHTQGLIPDADHVFVEQQFQTIAILGETTDACILKAVDTPGTITCLNTAVTAVDQINAQGGLALKSDKAKTDFAVAMTGIRTVLATVSATLGGN